MGSSFFKAIELLQADKKAWDALDVISAHFYGMPSNPRAAAIIRHSGKKLWMTESSNRPPDDVRAATISTGMCLNDLNHMASRWFWFIGYVQNNPKHDRNGSRLIAFWRNRYQYERLLKYYYFQALSQTFDVGAVFRKTMSSLDGNMAWQGKTSPPPHVTVSAVKNPDNSWGVAIVDYTVGPDTPQAMNPEWKWSRRPGHPQQAFNVTVMIDELSGHDDISFTVYRTNRESKNIQDQDVMMHNGKVTIKVSPMELAVLRTQQ